MASIATRIDNPTGFLHHLPGSNALEADPRAFCTPDRTVPVPDVSRRAGKNLARRDNLSEEK
jgi:hypothetical protein